MRVTLGQNRKLNNIRKLIAIVISIFCIGNVIFSQEKVSTEALLKAFNDDFKKNDIFPENPLEFGIRIHRPKGGEWKIKIDENKKISLEKGLPEKPTFNVISDLKTLVKVRRGEMNALTAAGKARFSDKDNGKLWGVKLFGPLMFVDPKTRIIVANQKDKEGNLKKKGNVHIRKLDKKQGAANIAINWAGEKRTSYLI